MILDLTLNSLKFPGLENYTPPFGTKKADNVGLTTQEGCINLAKPWQDQRPLTISENSSFSGDIERNATIEIDTASVTLTLEDATFKGCRLTVLATFSSGSASVLFDSVTYTIKAATKTEFIYDGANWQIDGNITAENISVATSDFEVDTTYEDYGYKAEISIAGVTSGHSPDVRFSLADSLSGIFAPVADTDTDTVIIYANAVPDSAITIPVIICTRIGA